MNNIVLKVGEEKFKVSIFNFDGALVAKDEFKRLFEADSFINHNANGHNFTVWHEWNNGSGLYNTRML